MSEMTNESNSKVAHEHFGGPSCDSLSLIFSRRYMLKKKTVDHEAWLPY